MSVLNKKPIRRDGAFVLYWMVAARRPRSNHALDRAVHLARETGRPLVVLEALRVGYPFASDRFHHFVLDGMADNRRAFAKHPVTYYPYVETRPGEGKGLVDALAQDAVAIVTDDFPAFFLPRMVRAFAERAPVRVEAVDGNGLLPMARANTEFKTAVSFRRVLQRTLPAYLGTTPSATPFDGLSLPRAPLASIAAAERWPAADEGWLGPDRDLSRLPIDHAVGRVSHEGGHEAARERLAAFLANDLPSYADKRKSLEDERTSRLSPYLHFGHVGAHEVFAGVVDAESWDPGRLSSRSAGQREGWWGMSAGAEAFLDQLVTWRELGFNRCSLDPHYADYGTLPEWARQTLEDHRADPREHLYDREQFEQAQTHDELWNAAQNQLRTQGRIHNYVRMLWGKKIIEWSESPQQALDTMVYLNDKYAVDGRDPNSYSGMLWCFGRYDRAWGPERPIFGKVRWMSSDNTQRKIRCGDYIARFGGGGQGVLAL
ncbi:MAG: deoxyribodipyrimidine photolyase [Myxococcales bacterium]|nr:deoxyribodipyrimidine photolyase [Myxococcales bacterium]